MYELKNREGIYKIEKCDKNSIKINDYINSIKYNQETLKYTIKNNKIKSKCFNFRNFIETDSNEKMNKYKVKILLRKSSTKTSIVEKIPNIKDIHVNELKDFLEQNLIVNNKKNFYQNKSNVNINFKTKNFNNNHEYYDIYNKECVFEYINYNIGKIKINKIKFISKFKDFQSNIILNNKTNNYIKEEIKSKLLIKFN